jgi:Fur family peroxide stress response transcriptional regulator
VIPTFSIEEVKKRISDAGLKATQQRIVIYNALLSTVGHPTAEKIFETIRPLNPTISLATVYKTLEALVNINLVSKVSSDQGSLRYDANLDAHNHIYCTNTKEIIDFEDAELEQLLSDFFMKKHVSNLMIKDIRLQINGEKIDLHKEVSIR